MKIINAICFNIGWFACVIFGNVAVPAVLVWVAIHIFLTQYRSNELRLILTVSTIGIILDTFLTRYQVFEFAQPVTLVPLWLIAIWLLFATTLNHSMSILSNRPLLQAALGFIFPPLSYYAGHKFGAVEFGYSDNFTLFTLALIWSPLLVLFMHLTRMKPFMQAKYTFTRSNGQTQL